ncbi:allophanate hydrolase subunit 1 [uncultured Psychromonas sp.]|uniref:5-oxoprolinase subunit B family protein n=1 Tax=uncultured Psychromonas sp. TaxID=173974 RepID=UPI002638403A|nr:allophanate hydrolase subunit 1 [uncultured Psychromonas sp.]
MQVNLVNENSVIIYFSDTVCAETTDKITHACQLFRSELSDTLLDIVPSYTSILLSCNLRKTGLQNFVINIRQILNELDNVGLTNLVRNKIVLPVYYGQEVALDHRDVSLHTGLAFSEIVKLHTEECYRVFAIGFTPGFAFLGNTPKEMTIPRKASPRLNVPKGSVAIADRQTAIYPSQSPGGWQVIGRTPVDLLDDSEECLSKFAMGDEVHFESIDKQTFLAMGGQL